MSARGGTSEHAAMQPSRTRARAAAPFFALLFHLAACGSSATPDAALGPDAASPLDSAVPSDVLTSDDAPAPADVPADVPAGDGAQCTVASGGTLQGNYYCDLAQIHVFQHADASAGVSVQARVGTGDPGCGAIDGVDVLRGTTMLAHLGATSGTVALGSQDAIVARGDAPTALVTECGSEAGRLGSYGLVIRGRDARGPFEARCGAAESGSRWPPGTALLCHRNVDAPPRGPGMISLMSIGGTSTVSFSVYLPHAAGQPAASAVEGTLRIVSPTRAPLDGRPPLMSRDSMGWMSHVSEGDLGAGPVTQVSMAAFGVVPGFDSELCPPPGTPGPGYVPPPWFIARLSGQGSSGAISAEVLTSCTAVGGP